MEDLGVVYPRRYLSKRHEAGIEYPVTEETTKCR
jgi:hypothetical protein